MRFFGIATATALFAISLSAGACAHPQAKTIAAVAPDVPLDVPAPPPRAIEPLTADALPPVGPVTEPPRGTAPRAQRPAPAAQTAPRPDAPKPEAPRADLPADGAKPADDAATRPAAAQPGQTVPTLQTTPAQYEAGFEARIHTQLARATADLNRIDYSKLNSALRSQYEFAKRSVSQAEDAIRARNLVYAQALADKAADIAAQLAGR